MEELLEALGLTGDAALVLETALEAWLQDRLDMALQQGIYRQD